MKVHEVTAKLAAVALEETSNDQDFILRALSAAIVESSDDAIVSKDLEGRILSWNGGAERLFGYTPEEVVGRSITLLIPLELHDEERRILEKLRRGERIDHFETTRIRKDGTRVPISLTISPIRNGRGEIVAASKIARNISERALADRLLREREESLSKLNDWTARLWHCRDLYDGLEEMLSVIIELLKADKGNVQLLDEERGVLKIAAQKGFDAKFLDFFREVTVADDSACGRALRCAQRIIIEDVEMDAGYESMREVARAAQYRAVVSIPLISVEGMPLGMLSAHFANVHQPTDAELSFLNLFVRLVSDFIQRCRIEDALRKSGEMSRDADRRKDEFLALLAHELRNPLAPIRYAISTIRNNGRTADQQTRAEAVIERQVAHMSRLLDDLLDVSRITRGSLELKKTRAELSLVIGTAIDEVRPLLDAKRHRFTLDLPKESISLEADPARLSQVFSNLLINAAQYTEPGGHIELRAVQNEREVEVAIRDNGIGISPEMRPALFELFSQARAAAGRSEGGLGVGLSLVRGLVTLHGGKVEVNSGGLNHGSEFIVRLPLGRPMAMQTDADAACSIEPTDNRAKMKILVVDDNRDAATSCAELLRLDGHDVRAEFSAQRAIEVATTFRPHVFVLDIGLPDMTGFHLAEKIRGTPWGAHALLIAVSGWGREEDKRRALQCGFDHHLTKPTSGEVLQSLVHSIAAPAS